MRNAGRQWSILGRKANLTPRFARLIVVAAIVVLSLDRRASADVPTEIVARGKKATALAELSGGYGSAFCIDASGVFVTNEHVARHADAQGRLKLILNTGEKNERAVFAKVVRADKDLDLAILQVQNPGALTSLPLGTTTGLIETMSVTAFGYPFGKDLAAAANEYPSVTVSTGHITALRKIQGELREIQLDASINPGNSGGPVIDAQGHVVGIIVAGIKGAGINFAIPVSDLSSLLSGVELVLTPTALPITQRRQAVTFVIQVVMFHHIDGDLSVQLTLSAGTGDHRVFTARATAPNTYVVKATPLPSGETASAATKTIDYHLALRQNGKLLAEQSGTMAFQAAPTLPATAPAPAIQNLPISQGDLYGDKFTVAIKKLVVAANANFADMKGKKTAANEYEPKIGLPGAADAVLEERDGLRLLTYIYTFQDRAAAEQSRSRCVEILKTELGSEWALEDRGSTVTFVQHAAANQQAGTPATVVISRAVHDSVDLFWLKITPRGPK